MAGWQTVPLKSPITVTSGQTVWLAWLFENNPGIRYASGTPGRAQSAGTWSAGMPATFGAASYADYQYSIYCTYTYTNEKSGNIPNDISKIESNQMYIGITAAYNDGNALKAGDKIEVFDGVKCVGSVVLTDSIDSTNTNSYANIIVNAENGYGNGYTEGNTISFKIWDSNKQKTKDVSTVIYKSDLASWNTSGTFRGGTYSFISLGESSYPSVGYPIPQMEIQTIVLTKGWNIFSTYLTPTELNMNKVLQELRDNGNLIKVIDEEGKEYSYDSSSQSWINNIGNINVAKGYKIKVNSDCSLQITGAPVKLPFDMELKSGWNIISVPYNNSVDAMEFVQPLIEAGILKKVQDEKGNSIEYWESIGWVDGIGSFAPGNGYKVLLSSEGYLPVKTEYLKSVISAAEPIELSHFIVNHPGNGMDHMNIYFQGLKQTKLQIGDEIAAFDGDICVGAVKLIDDNMMNNAVSINASFSGESIENGFLEGSIIEIKIWYASSNNEFNQEISVINGNQVYERSGSVFVNALNQNVTTSNMIDFDASKINMFPNPAIDLVNIRFSEFPANGTKIKLRDNIGREMIVKEVQSTQEILDIQALPNGMYIVEIISGEQRVVNKLIKK